MPRSHVRRSPALGVAGSHRWTLVSLLLVLSLLGSCALPRLVPRAPSYAMPAGEHTTLGRAFGAQAAAHPGLSGFQVITAAQSGFAARAALADAAESTLDLQYYSVGDDLTSDLLLQRLLAAAQRGVRVRILLDDIQPSTRVFARRAAAVHAAIEVRLFNPFFFGGTWSLSRLVQFAFDGERLNRRMHNKLWVTDNAAAIVGSRNLGDEYFGIHEAANFNDVDLLAIGPIVRDLSEAFDLYWNSASAVPLAGIGEAVDAAQGPGVHKALQSRSNACNGDAPPCRWLLQAGLVDALRAGNVALSWARGRAIYDHPDLDKSGLTHGVEHDASDDEPAGSRTQSELLIVAPYFIPDESRRHRLAEAVQRGARVAVLTNSLASTDSPAAHAGYARHRVELLRSGVALYESRPEPGASRHLRPRWSRVSPSSLHAKVVVQDRVRALVGSFNQDARSRLHNTEACIALESAELAADLAELFEEASDLDHSFKLELSAAAEQQIEWQTEVNGKIKRYGDEPIASAWLRLWRGVLGALVPEHEL